MKIRRDRLRLLKFLSPLLSGLILLAVFFWPSQTATLGEYSKSSLNLKNEIKTFKLKGTFNGHHTFILISKRGEDIGEGKIDLDFPELEVKLENGNTINIKADKATLDQTKNILLIETDMEARHSLGYFFKSPRAEIIFD